jgi:hypothetical protein
MRMPVNGVRATLLLVAIASWATAEQPSTITQEQTQNQAEERVVNTHFPLLLAAALPDTAVVGYLRPTALLDSPDAKASEASVTASDLASRHPMQKMDNQMLELVRMESLAGLHKSYSWAFVSNLFVIAILSVFLVLDIRWQRATAARVADAVKTDKADDTTVVEKNPSFAFGSDLYMNSPLSLFPLEVYDRGASQVAVSLVLAIFPRRAKPKETALAVAV